MIRPVMNGGTPYATITIVMAARTRVNSAAKIEGNEVIKKTQDRCLNKLSQPKIGTLVC